MKKSYLAIFAIVVLGLVFWSFRKKANDHSVSAALSKDKQTQAVKLTESARLPITTSPEISAAPSAEANVNDKPIGNTNECSETLRRLSNLSVESTLGQLQGQMLDSDLKCLRYPTGIPKGFGDFESCKKLNQNPNDTQAKSDCTLFLTFFRAYTIGRAYAGHDNYDSMELSLLVNKIIANFLSLGQMNAAQTQEWQKMTEALLNRNPENLQAVKANLISHMDEFDPRKPNSLSPELIEHGLELNPNDSQLTELKLFNEISLPDAQSRLESFIESQPDSAIGHYALANLLWKNQNRQAAITQLQAAQQLDPQSQRFKDTLVAATNPQTGPEAKIFTLQLQFDFQNL